MNDNERNAFADMAIAAIRRAKPDETVIVIVANDSGSTTQVRGPDAMRLCHAAAGLLDSAADELPEGDDLAEAIAEALDVLPDRFEGGDA
jgi:hypothetical protein